MSQANHEEFVRLLSRHQRQIWRFINTLLPVESDADDVMQETSLVLWRRWDTYDKEREFISWAFGIARRQVMSFVRKHRSTRRYLDEAVLESIALVAQKKNEDLAQVEECRETLRECIQKLEEKEREVVQLRYLHAASTKAIAEAQGKPLATVYSILARARDQLTDCVRRSIAHLESGQ